MKIVKPVVKMSVRRRSPPSLSSKQQRMHIETIRGSDGFSACGAIETAASSRQRRHRNSGAIETTAPSRRRHARSIS